MEERNRKVLSKLASCNIKIISREGADVRPEGFTEGWKRDIILLPGNEMVYGERTEPINALKAFFAMANF